MKKLFLAVSALTIIASPAAAETVGNAVQQRATVDGCTTCVFVINQKFGASGLTLASYDLWANRIGNITPLLLTRSDSGTTASFTITGIGAQRTVATPGFNSFSFDATQGSGTTGANSYFGFAYNNATGGVVAFDYFTDGGTNSGGAFVGPSGYVPEFGGTFTSDFGSQPANSYDALNARTYSISATATPAVPEPASWAMMIVGFGVVGGTMRRRAKVRTTLAYA